MPLLALNQISALKSEKQHLSEAVASLQERAQSTNEARVREVESENRLLQKNITDSGCRLASLESQLKVAVEEAGRLRERAARCEELERETAKLERSRDALNRQVGLKSVNNAHIVGRKSSQRELGCARVLSLATFTHCMDNSCCGCCFLFQQLNSQIRLHCWIVLGERSR